MAHENFRGFVLRTVRLGEADRLLSILTAERGLVTAVARGAERVRSPMLAATQIFALSDFTAFAHKGRLTIDSAELAEPFLKLREDLDRLVCAAHLAEVFLDLARDDLTGPELYSLWAYSCQAVQSQADPFLVTHAAQIRALAVSGFAPRLDRCLICHQEPAGDSWFDLAARGLLCAADYLPAPDREASKLSPAARSCLNYILQSPMERLFAFRLNETVRQEVCQFADRYLTLTMEKAYTRLALLQDLWPAQNPFS
jgi:DNA repair protein RecO (recombination protein O)